jgi:hypothetical protein
MYVFSASAKTPKPFDDFSENDEVPFIVYINFKDLFGAQKLCTLYLMQQGFHDVVIEKRKLIEDRFLQDKKLIQADKALKEALDDGYSIQVFSAH